MEWLPLVFVHLQAQIVSVLKEQLVPLAKKKNPADFLSLEHFTLVLSL